MDKTPGQIAFEAYNTSTGGKTWNGKNVPPWEAIKEATPHVCEAWEAAAAGVLLHVDPEILANALFESLKRDGLGINKIIVRAILRKVDEIRSSIRRTRRK